MGEKTIKQESPRKYPASVLCRLRTSSIEILKNVTLRGQRIYFLVQKNKKKKTTKKKKTQQKTTITTKK